MSDDHLRDRITDQFSYRGSRADIWRVFDLLLDTDAFLNLGYSEWYQPHVGAASQRRLVSLLGQRLAAYCSRTQDVRLLDVGCGRGGPTVHLAERFGFRTAGVDLVPYNVTRARENAAERGVDASFVVGDATSLPFAPASIPAVVAVDAFVYLPDRAAVFAEIADVLQSDGVVVFSDLLARADLADDDRRAVSTFADAWDMPDPGTQADYERALAAAGLDVVDVEDISAHSVGQFRKWTGLFGRLHGSPLGPSIDRLLARYDLDPQSITDQVRLANAALPSLRHLLFVAGK
jgi:MPBQ/MSBQ methyltransferase